MFARCFLLAALALGAFLPGPARADRMPGPMVANLTLEGGKTDLSNAVVRVPLPANAPPYRFAFVKSAAYPNGLLAQVAPVSLANGGNPKALEATFVLPKLPAGKKTEVTLTLAFIENQLPEGLRKPTSFKWTDEKGDAPTLFYGENKLLAYVRPKFDPNAGVKDKPTANPTTKVYHHLFDKTGKVQLSNGAEGQFPHHRGIYFGFNRVSYNGKNADVWHCNKGESQQHNEVKASVAGVVFGREVLGIDWNGQDGKKFIDETRELTIYQLATGTMIDFTSQLATSFDKVRLDGDPQHAGFHYRGAQDMEKNKNETYFLRPDGPGEKGKERNWEPKSKAGPKNLPWNAMCAMVGGKRYTIVYLDHPDNPKEARQSERSYGRIGTYFEYDLTKDKPLTVRYRLWVQEGEMKVDECNQLSEAFIAKPKVELEAFKGK